MSMNMSNIDIVGLANRDSIIRRRQPSKFKPVLQRVALSQYIFALKNIFTHRSLLSFIICSLIPLSIDAQNGIEPIKTLISSPEAAEMAKYGNMEVSLFKGVPQIRIPIHTIQLKDFSLPIQLSYDAGGVKVDQIATNVGLGWSLQAGGMIVAQSYGESDQDMEFELPSNFQSFDPNGYVDTDTGQKAIDYAYAWSLFDPMNGGVRKNTRSDLYFVSYPGGSGKFVVSGTGYMFSAHMVPYSDHTISVTQAGYVMIDSDGNRYEYEDVETATTDVNNCGGGPGAEYGANMPFNAAMVPQSANTWHLSRIVTTNQDTLEFTYTELVGFQYDEGVVQTKYIMTQAIAGTCSSSPIDYQCQVKKTVIPLVLSRIRHRRSNVTVEEVQFVYDTVDREDFGNSSYGRLKEIKMYRDDQIMFTHTLNHTYFQSGGSSQANKRLKLDSVSLYNTLTHSFVYNTSGNLPERGSYAQDLWGFYNGVTSNETMIPNGSGLTGMADRSVNVNTVGYWTLNRIVYPTGGASVIEMQADSEGGGLRIHRQFDLSGMGDTTNVKTYTYERETFMSPEHVDAFISRRYEHDTPQIIPECFYDTYSASSVAQVMLMGGPDYGYYEVSVEYGQDGEFGKTVSKFSRGQYELGGAYVSLSLDALPWGRGELMSKTHYKWNGTSYQPIQRELHNHRVYFNDENGMWDSPDEPFESYIYGMQIKLNKSEVRNNNLLLLKAAEFSVHKYRIVSAWHHADNVKSQIFDEHASVWRTMSESNYSYASAARLAVLEQINSDGQSKITIFAYGVAGKPSKLTSYTERTSGGSLFRKRSATWSSSLGSSRAEIYRIHDFTSETNSIQVAEYPSYDIWGNPLVSVGELSDTTHYYYGSNSTPFSQSGHGGVKGRYLTGIQQVIGTADVITGGIRPTGGSVNDLFTEALYDSLGRIMQLFDANEVKTGYEYDDLQRLIRIFNHTDDTLSVIEYNNVGSGLSVVNPNWIRTTNHMSSTASTITTSFFDGLGLPIQSQMEIGGNSAIVQHTFYDSQGRKQAITRPGIWNTNLTYKSASSLVGGSWQPGNALPTTGSDLYAYNRNTLGHSTDDSKYAYSQNTYHPDPMNRIHRQAGPGHTWRLSASGGSDRTVRASYGLNDGGAERFLGFGDAELQKQTVIDENLNHSWTFTDGWGRTIAQVVDLGIDSLGHVSTGDIITRFKYDLLGNLTHVYEPKSYPGTSTYVREYTYDYLGRLIIENSPDLSSTTDYLYDKAGNLRFVRNAEHMRNPGNSTGSHNLSYLATTGSTLAFPKNGYMEFSVNFSGLDADEVELRLVKIGGSGSPNRILWSKWFAVWDASIPNVRVPMESGQYRFEATASYETDAWTAIFSDTRHRYEFQYNKYDALNRLIESGEYYGDPAHFTQSNAENAGFPTSNKHILVENSYDASSSHPATPSNLKGRLARSRYFDAHSWQFGDTWYSYNVQGLPEWINHKLPGSGSNKRINYSYDRLGNITKTDYQPSVPGERIIFWYTYDQAGRLWKVHSNRIDNFSLAKLDAEYSYTAEGQVDKMALGGSFTGGGAQLMDYRYNIRGWLTSINDMTLSSQSGFATDRFAMHLGYDSFLQSNGNFEAQYNGNISQVRWKLHPSIIDVDDDPAYTYKYDNAGRLTLADFTNTSVGADPWDVRNITYDKNGNFETLRRYSESGSNQYLQYGYHSGTNRLRWTSGSSTQYSYDQLGNQISNSTAGRKITSTAYDGRNLPIRMIQTKHSDSGVAQLHRYGYDAAGNRVRKRFLPGATMWGETGFDYIRGADGAVIAVYNQSGTLLYWNLPGGLGQIIK